MSLAAFSPLGFACESSVTLKLKATNYSGLINVELRKGQRPGSKIAHRASVNTSGTVVVPNVCPGSYFFAFATPDSDAVSVTRYFTVINDGESYSNPVVTITFSRSASADSAKVGSASKKDL